MALKTEGQHTAEFVVSEAEAFRSREKITVLSGQNLDAGEVVGRVTRGAGKADIPTVVGTGDGVMSALFAGPDVEIGNYVVTCITAAANGGTFSVTTPSGNLLKNAVVGTAYRSSHVNFLIADGATDFIVGDAFTVVVATGAPTVVGTGNGTIASITLGRAAKAGRYLVRVIQAITNGGEIEVVSPDGDVVHNGYIVAGAGGTLVRADGEQLNFTITEGSTDFAVGDFFEIFVFNQLAGGKVVEWDPATFDGRNEAAGVLYGAVDASAADKEGTLIVREAEVRKADLQWATTVTAGEKEVAYKHLEALGVVAR